MESSLPLVCHSPKSAHSSPDHFLFWEPRCPAPSTWESLGVKIDQERGPSALQGWAWAAAAHVPHSSSPKPLPQHKESIWPESQVTV